MSSGDVGHFDDEGRLFVDGRDDDMIVSGGENVFPQEVEDLLAGHEKIAEAAVFGVDDEEFGQRLKAVVVDQGRRPLRGRGQEVTSRRTSPATRSRATSSSSTSCRATRPARCSSASSRTTSPRTPRRPRTSSYSGGMPQRTDIFDLARLGLTSGEGRRLDLHTAIEPFDYGGQRYEVDPALVPVRLDVSRTTGNGWALRLRFDAGAAGPVHALPGARRAELRRRRPRGLPARRRRGADLALRRARTGSSTCRRGRATRWRSRCPRRSPAAPTAPACARSAAPTSTRTPSTRHEAPRDPRFDKLSEIRFD